jgi:hypothetical protein
MDEGKSVDIVDSPEAFNRSQEKGAKIKVRSSFILCIADNHRRNNLVQVHTGFKSKSLWIRVSISSFPSEGFNTRFF